MPPLVKNGSTERSACANDTMFMLRLDQRNRPVVNRPRQNRDLRCGISAVEPPLWVNNGHRGGLNRCLLYPQKQTLELSRVMSALYQKQTLARLSDHLTGFPQPTKPSPQSDNPSVNWPGMCAMRELM